MIIIFCFFLENMSININKRTVFNTEYIHNNEWSWLTRYESNPFVAKCTVRRTYFQLSNMGSKTAKSHAKREKHMWNMNNSDPTKSNLKMYFKAKTTEKSTNNSLSQQILY